MNPVTKDVVGVWLLLPIYTIACNAHDEGLGEVAPLSEPRSGSAQDIPPQEGVDIIEYSPRLVARWDGGPSVSESEVLQVTEAAAKLGIVVENRDTAPQLVTIDLLVENGTGMPIAVNLGGLNLDGDSDSVIWLDLFSLPNTPGTDYSGSLMGTVRGMTPDGLIHESVTETLFWHANDDATYALYGEKTLSEVFSGGDVTGQHAATLAGLDEQGIFVSRISFGGSPVFLSEEEAAAVMKGKVEP